MRINPFSSQLERLARTLTDQFGVTVFCNGDQAYTDGRRIVLPSLPEPMDESLERMVVGYLDHEMAHVAFTDFKEVRRFVEKHRGFKDLLNAVEDALIEKRAMQRWPGVRANLDALFRQVRTRVMTSVAAAKPFHRFAVAVYLRLSHHRDLLGLDGELIGLEDLLDEFPSVRTTRDAAALSSKLLKRWLQRMTTQSPQQTAQSLVQNARKPHSEKGEAISEFTGDADASRGELSTQNQATDSPSDGDESDGDDGDSNASSATDRSERPASEVNATDPKMPPDSQGASAEGEASPGESEAADEAPANAATALSGSDDGGSLIGKVVAEAIAEAAQHVDGNAQYRIFTKEYDHIDVVPDADDAAVSALRATAADTVRRLRRGLANALRSAEKRWWREEQSSGDLSPKTLHRVCLDRASLTIFRSRAIVHGKSTAVSLALDASGSMSTSKMDVARDAVRVLLEALHDLKIPTEAFTFTTGDAFDADKAAAEAGVATLDLRQRYSRFGNLEIGLIKRFEDSVKVAMRRLPNIVGTGLTPIGEALDIGARRLIVRSENRKILLILTDGQPCCEGNGPAAFTHATHVARQVTNAGIELVGVGIMDSALCSIVANTIVVNQIEDLPAQLCKLLCRTLKKGLRHVR